MTSPTGNRTNAEPRRAAAFTLIELILVMAMLVIVLGVSFPTLKKFFQGRDIDSEARRFLSLTHYGRSRAISEGVPVVLWIDAKGKSYGLQIQTGYTESDSNAVQYALSEKLEVEARLPMRVSPQRSRPSVPGLANAPTIRFMPDGTIGEASPDQIVLRQGGEDAVWIVENTNRLSYAIQGNSAQGR
jgi:type II secretion system protein H